MVFAQCGTRKVRCTARNKSPGPTSRRPRVGCPSISNQLSGLFVLQLLSNITTGLVGRLRCPSCWSSLAPFGRGCGGCKTTRDSDSPVLRHGRPLSRYVKSGLTSAWSRHVPARQRDWERTGRDGDETTGGGPDAFIPRACGFKHMRCGKYRLLLLHGNSATGKSQKADESAGIAKRQRCSRWHGLGADMGRADNDGRGRPAGHRQCRRPCL